MAHDEKVIMPLMGEGVNEATIIKWLRNPGQNIEIGEPLVQVSTDKVDTEIVAPHSGFLIATFSKEGDVIEVNQVIAQISKNADAKVIDAPTTQTNPLSKTSPAKAGLQHPPVARKHNSDLQSAPTTGRVNSQSPLPLEHAGFVRTSPIVRKMAKEQGIDLRLVTGSGALGRITKADLQDFIASGGDRRVAQMVHQDQDRLPQVGDAIFQCDTKTNEDGDEFLEGVQVRREKMSKIRRLTAERMIRSVRTSPHVTTTFAIDLHRMVQAKNNLAQSFISKHGIKLTYTPFFLEASVHALKEHPIVNASVDGDDILFKEDIQLGCAVAINTGLIVPVIKKAQNLDLSGLALELNSLVNKARNNQLSPADLQGGTFSITNPGMFGCLHSSPIINQPQVAIMSIGAIVEQPVVVEGQIVVRPICHVGLTFDHRIIDGEGGTKFLASLKNFLETYPPS